MESKPNTKKLKAKVRIKAKLRNPSPNKTNQRKTKDVKTLKDVKRR